jgi:hypothetical protein
MIEGGIQGHLEVIEVLAIARIINRIISNFKLKILIELPDLAPAFFQSFSHFTLK